MPKKKISVYVLTVGAEFDGIFETYVHSTWAGADKHEKEIRSTWKSWERRGFFTEILEVTLDK